MGALQWHADSSEVRPRYRDKFPLDPYESYQLNEPESDQKSWQTAKFMRLSYSIPYEQGEGRGL